MRATFLRHKYEWLTATIFCADRDKIQALSCISRCAVPRCFWCIVKFHSEFDTFFYGGLQIFSLSMVSPSDFFKTLFTPRKTGSSFLRSNYELNFWLMVDWSGPLKERRLYGTTLRVLSELWWSVFFFFMWGHQFPFSFFFVMSGWDRISQRHEIWNLVN